MRRALACVALATLAAAAPQPKPTSTGGNAQRDTPQFEAGDLGLSEDMLQAMIKEILGAGAPNILSDLAAAFDNDGAAPQGLQGAQDSPPGNPSSAGTDTGSGDHGQGSASTGDGIPDIAQLLGGIDWASVFADSGLADIVGDVDLNTLLGGAEDSVGGPATGLPDAAALQELFGQDLSTILDGTAGTVGDLEAMQKRLQLLAQMDPGVEGPGQVRVLESACDSILAAACFVAVCAPSPDCIHVLSAGNVPRSKFTKAAAKTATTAATPRSALC